MLIMVNLWNLVYLLSLSLWTGAAVFFTFLATPSLFGDLPRDGAAQAVAAIFPHYYNLGMVALSLAAAVGLIRAWRATQDKPLLWLNGALLGVAAALTLYGGWGLLPRLEALQVQIPTFALPAGNDLLRLEFQRLHGLSMGLNLAALLCSLGSLILTALFPPVLGAAKAVLGYRVGSWRSY